MKDIRLEATIRLRNEHLISEREARGFTQKQMAMVCGVSHGMWVHYELLRAWPGDAVQQKIADAFDKKREEIFPEALKDARAVTFKTRKSFDAMEFAELSGTLPTLISDSIDPYEAAEAKLRTEDLTSEIKALLTSREQEIIRLYFTEVWPDSRIGSHLGITGGRVGQIRHRAQGKLGRSSKLKSYREDGIA